MPRHAPPPAIPPRTPRPARGERDRARRLYAKLEALYPDAHCALHHRDAFELLVATILSAQCTDEVVNRATPALFAAYPDPRKLAAAEIEEVEKLVKTCGFYRNKARNIKAAAQVLVERFGGEVPRTLEELVTLPGAARKTANVVLGNAFGINEGVVVDTHVGRLAVRLGLTRHGPKDAVKIERDLMSLFPRETWTKLSHLLIWHGRAICKARNPACAACPLLKSCPRIGVEPARSRS